MKRTEYAYAELEVVPVPDDIPELGIRAGTMGTVVDVLAEGRLVTIEVLDNEGYTIDMIDVWMEPEPRVISRWHLGED